MLEGQWNKSPIIIKSTDRRRKQGFQIGEGTSIHPDATLTKHSNIPDPISIGENCIVSSNVALIGHDASSNIFLEEVRSSRLTPINIGNWCYFGWGSIIVGPVRIGDRCIIGAGAVVVHSIPSNTVVAGNPARKISSIEEYLSKRRTELYNCDRITDKSGTHVIVRGFKDSLKDSY